MISPSSGDRKAISANSKASTASQSSASDGEDGMRSGGRPRVATADAHSRPGRAMVRRPMGVSLSSPKQPQPESGRRCLISFSTPTATRKNSAVPVRTTDELPDQAVADHARESDMAEVVRRALDRLPQRMRTAVMLRYFEDMTEPEIAATLGISLGTMKSTVSRAVAKLRIDTELGEDADA